MTFKARCCEALCSLSCSGPQSQWCLMWVLVPLLLREDLRTCDIPSVGHHVGGLVPGCISALPTLLTGTSIYVFSCEKSVHQAQVFFRESCITCTCCLGELMGGGELKILLCCHFPHFPVSLS